MMKKLHFACTLCLAWLLSASAVAQNLSGGPDAYGYTWVSSHNLATGAVNDASLHSWEDISTTGTEITGLGDDNVLGPFAIGFDFPYYWNTYNQFYIGSNGYIMFGRGINISSDAFGFPVLPTPANATSPSNYLAPMLCDLTFTDENGQTVPTATAYYHTAADSCIITFANAAFWQRDAPGQVAGSNTFQVVLHSNGNISYNYLEQDGEVDPAYIGASVNFLTRGIENLTGQDGLGMGNNQYPVENSSIRFTYPTNSTFEIRDVSSNWIFNSDNRGVFASNSDSPYTITAQVANTGNVNITDATPITVQATISDFSDASQGPVNALASNVTINSLDAGATQVVTFPISIPQTLKDNAREQRYRVTVRVTMDNDQVSINNSVNAQFIIVDTTRESGTLLSHDRFPYAPQPQIWDRPYGGNDGFVTTLKVGNRFEPPFHPCYIHAVEFGIVALSNGELVPDTISGYISEIYGQNGPTGGSPLATVTVGRDDVLYNYDFVDSGTDFIEVAEITTNRHNLATPIRIDAGSFFVTWQRHDDDAHWLERSLNGLGTDGQLLAPLSFSGYEIQGNIWSDYRNRMGEDFAIRAWISPSNEPLWRQRHAASMFTIGTPYPQPAQAGQTTIRLPFSSDQTTKLRVVIHNLQGQEVAQLATQRYLSGSHVIELPTQHLPAGTYLYQAKTEHGTQTGKLLLQ